MSIVVLLATFTGLFFWPRCWIREHHLAEGDRFFTTFSDANDIVRARTKTFNLQSEQFRAGISSASCRLNGSSGTCRRSGGSRRY